MYKSVIHIHGLSVFVTDENECARGGTNQCAQTCINNIGSYTCSCFRGYTLNADGKTCNGESNQEDHTDRQTY